MADLKKGARITGTQRDKLANDLKKKYEKGASIRALAESTGRSYGFVHRVLSETGCDAARTRWRHADQEDLVVRRLGSGSKPQPVEPQRSNAAGRSGQALRPPQ